MPSTPDTTPARGGAAAPARRVRVDPEGPVLVEGPVEIALDDGTIARSDRFMVAVCTCRRSRAYPWCDTSHRRRERAAAPPEEPGKPELKKHEEPGKPGKPEEGNPS